MTNYTAKNRNIIVVLGKHRNIIKTWENKEAEKATMMRREKIETKMGGKF